jgi:TP901 family phage tail tape measure protein
MMTDDAKTNASNISDIGDAMAYVSVQTKAGMADVAESFKTTTGLAQRYGITVQETAVLLEKIGKRGLVGSNAGTLLRNMVEDLLGSPNNRNAAKIREALGMGMFEKGKDSPLVYLQQVFEKYRALNAAQKQAFDANMLNERGRRPFSILAEESENLTDALKTLEERSEGLLDKLVSGLEGDVKLAFQAAGAALENSFMSAIEGSEDSLLQLANMLEETFRSEGFRGGLRDFISLLSDAARWVTENTELIKQLAIGYAVFKGAGLMVGVIGSFLKIKDALGGIGTAAGVAQGGLTGLASRLENVARIFTSNPILLRFIQFASTNPAILAGAVPATIALNIVAKDLSMPSKEDYAEGARNKIGLTSNTSIEDLDADAARTALQKSNSELDRYNSMSWHTRNSLPDYETIKRDNAALKERVDYFNELARFAGKTPPEPPKVIKRDGGGPEDGPGVPFNLGGGGGGRQNFDRTPLREVQSATKLANAEYDQAMASIELYKQGLDLRKNARMVGEKEYQQTLDALAELEIQKGIEREGAIQRAIEAALPKVKDSSMREQLTGDMEASLQKEQTLMTKAYTDKALAQLKAEISRKEFLENVEKLEAESFGSRLTAQQQFIRDWNANNQDLMDRAMADGDMESFMRLLNIKDRGMEDAKKEDRFNLASLMPEDSELRLEALRARHMEERDELLKLTREGSEERHRLERELEYRHGLEMSQERLTAFSQFMSAGEQLAGGMANLVGMVAGEQSEAYRVMFAASKAFAIADATMNMYTAISKAMAFEGPMGWAQIGPVMASMSALIGQISSVNYAGAFDKGGIIPAGKWGIVGEYGPEIVSGPANVTSREKTAEILRGSDQQPTAQAQPPVVNVRNINVLDPALVGDYLGTDEGEKLIMNVVQRNRRALA